MSEYCDRSPCDKFLGQLGHTIFAQTFPEGPRFHFVAEGGKQLFMEYCPFCGTRLDQTEVKILEKYIVAPKKRAFDG